MAEFISLYSGSSGNSSVVRCGDHYLIIDMGKGVRTTGAAFCLSGAGPTLLCITRNPGLEEKLAKKLDAITQHQWQMLPLHVEFQGAHIV